LALINEQMEALKKVRTNVLGHSSILVWMWIITLLTLESHQMYITRQQFLSFVAIQHT
jgi:hypothetical protein